jgi:hypothetical protein
MAKWNIEELKDLCSAKGKTYPVDYINSLPIKQRISELHAEEANRIWKELHSTSFVLGDEKFERAYFLYISHIECCANSLRSMIECLMHIINIVLDGGLPEEGVGFGSIKRKLKGDPRYKNVYGSLNLLGESDSYRYLSAFSNINKHYRFLKGIYTGEFGEETRNEQGIIFEGFRYKNREYSQMWGIDIIENQRKKIIALLLSVGISINEDLKNIKT